ncbi:MAG: ABC transporter substrate-binding protein [Lachnospiraceae bacterium]|nr:ABC transporter substrate-binding protein [Lachnospiraceae bacterium]
MMATGCGSAAETATTSSAPAETTAASEAPAAGSESASGEKIKIEYWHCNADDQGGKTVEDLVSAFNESNDHIEVVAKYNPDMYKGLMQNLQAEVATGKSPAVVQIGWAFLDYFSNNFSYISPQDAIDKYDTEDPTFLTGNFLPNVLELAVNSDGSQVGIPYSLSNPVLYYNKDLFKEAGLSDEGPTTWEQVIEYSKTIKEKTGKYGLYIQEPADNWATQALLESNGAKFITKEGDKTQATFASEEGIAAYQAWADMVADGTALNISWDEGMQAFNQGEVAMTYTTIARRANIQSSAAFDVAAVNSPVWEGKERAIPAGGCFLAITAQSEEEQAAAWEFEKYLYSIQSMAAWTEGTGYVPPRKDVADSPEGLKTFLKENEMMKAATTQMDSVHPWTSFPGDAGLQAEQILLDTRDQILSGSVTAQEGLTKAQDDINALLGN